MFQFHQVPFFHWFNFNSSDFFPNLFVFSQSSSCLFNLHSLLVHTLRHTLMYAFQSPFLFFASCCTGPKKFFSTFNLSVTKNPTPANEAKVLSKAPPGSFSCSQCDSVMGSVGFLPGPNPASFPNPVQIKLRLRAKGKALNYYLK